MSSAIVYNLLLLQYVITAYVNFEPMTTFHFEISLHFILLILSKQFFYQMIVK